MSRVAKAPVSLPQGVTATISGAQVTVKGAKGSLSLALKTGVTVEQADKALNIKYSADDAVRMLAGSTRAHLANMVEGVSKGFERKLELQGVGYRAQAQGKVLNLTLGYSHPVNFAVPDGITIETPTQTEIVIKGIDRQVVGETAAKIRAYRPPEPYKGKGVKYSDEFIFRKEGKKK
jgi:large subunit ribosomal protein L6